MQQETNKTADSAKLLFTFDRQRAEQVCVCVCEKPTERLFEQVSTGTCLLA